ncbi:MAG TPA: tetratricopeptide repeat protein [Terriglobales bacterium]|nr:tetratricopeptide repeat protein [Terriglobales bacterium]
MKAWGIVLGTVVCCAASGHAQVSVAKEKPRLKSDPVPHSQTEKPAPIDQDQGQSSKPSVRPRNSEESSSRDTIIDLSPPDSGVRRPVRDDDEEETTGVNELKPWNPHKAEKSIEVGEYYFKEKNYKAAISRYREALEYKPRDAVATYRLGEVLERTGQNEEALQRYEEYLKILKDGPFAEECKQGIGRIKKKKG